MDYRPISRWRLVCFGPHFKFHRQQILSGSDTVQASLISSTADPESLQFYALYPGIKQDRRLGVERDPHGRSYRRNEFERAGHEGRLEEFLQTVAFYARHQSAEHLLVSSRRLKIGPLRIGHSFQTYSISTERSVSPVVVRFFNLQFDHTVQNL